MRKPVVDYIGRADVGGEAKIREELRTRVPGLGGTIKTDEGVQVAFRMQKSISPPLKEGHRMLLRHTILKKLDDLFLRTGRYESAHVTRPFSSISKPAGQPCPEFCGELCGQHRETMQERHCEAYLYEWAKGTDNIAVEEFRKDDDGEYRYHNFKTLDFNECCSCFFSVGINFLHDLTQDDDARMGKNIVHQDDEPFDGGFLRSPFWKRIDFGVDSLPIQWDILVRFLHDKRRYLVKKLRAERYEMMRLAVMFLNERERITEREIGILETLVGDYRRASMTQYVMGLSPTRRKPELIWPITESLI